MIQVKLCVLLSMKTPICWKSCSMLNLRYDMSLSWSAAMKASLFLCWHYVVCIVEVFAQYSASRVPIPPLCQLPIRGVQCEELRGHGWLSHLKRTTTSSFPPLSSFQILPLIIKFCLFFLISVILFVAMGHGYHATHYNAMMCLIGQHSQSSHVVKEAAISVLFRTAQQPVQLLCMMIISLE